MHLSSLRQLPLQSWTISRNLKNMRIIFSLLFFFSNYLHQFCIIIMDAFKLELFSFYQFRVDGANQYIMDQINKKRTQWRNNIRRNELQEQKKRIRKEVCTKENRLTCINRIEEIIQRSPRNVLMELAEEVGKQDSQKKRMFSECVWSYLTSPHFSNSKRPQAGLGNLVLRIYGHLSDNSKLLLACPTIVTSLLREYSRCLEGKDTNFFNQLGNVCSMLCFQTLRQSNFDINLTEQQIKHIIKNAHSSLSIQDLSVLMPLLITLQANQIDNSMRCKLAQIQRRMIHLINNHQNRMFYLRLITAISYFIPLQHHNFQIINTIFDQWRQIGFQLVLRYFSSQSEEQSLDWQTYRFFLLSCQQNMQTKGEIRYYLIGICNLIENAFDDSKAVMDMYHLLLSNRLHHYVKDVTWNIVSIIVYQLFKENQLKDSRELLSCALKILQKYGRIMEKEMAFDFSNRLLLQQYSQQEILSSIGEQRFMQFWQLYQESQRDP